MSKTPRPRPPSRRSPAARAAELDDWRDETLARLRSAILAGDPDSIEEVKWRKPSNPDGVPVWSHAGIICIGNVLKSAVRLTFPHGAELDDPAKLFNTRLDSRTVRAIDVHEGERIRSSDLRKLVREAVRVNLKRTR